MPTAPGFGTAQFVDGDFIDQLDLRQEAEPAVRAWRGLRGRSRSLLGVAIDGGASSFSVPDRCIYGTLSMGPGHLGDTGVQRFQHGLCERRSVQAAPASTTRRRAPITGIGPTEVAETDRSAERTVGAQTGKWPARPGLTAGFWITAFTTIPVSELSTAPAYKEAWSQKTVPACFGLNVHVDHMTWLPTHSSAGRLDCRASVIFSNRASYSSPFARAAPRFAFRDDTSDRGLVPARAMRRVHSRWRTDDSDSVPKLDLGTASGDGPAAQRSPRAFTSGFSPIARRAVPDEDRLQIELQPDDFFE